MARKTETPLRRALRLGTVPLVFAGLFSAVSNVLYFALPIYTNQVYSRVLQSQSGETLIVLTLGVLFVFTVSAVMDVIRARVLIDFGTIFDRYLSGQVFAALFDAVVKRQMSPRAQALRDLDTFRGVLTGPAVAVLFDVPFVPIFLGALFFVSPWIGAVGAIGAAILLGLTVWQDKATRAISEKSSDTALETYAFTDSALRNSEVVRALGMLPTLGSEWARRRADSAGRSSLASHRTSLFVNVIKMLRLFVQILIIALGAWLIMKQRVPSGMLFANMILSARALAPIDRLVGSWTSLVGAAGAYRRLDALLNRYERPSPATLLPRPTGALKVEDMGFAMPGAPRLLLANLNFALRPGETLGVVGPSGAGKSTLARMLVGVWKPYAGHIRLDGADVYSWDRASFGRYVGYLPQDVELFAGTVRDNIARFRTDATDEDVIDAARLAGAHELILSLAKGYDTELGEGGAVLSAGQRQRVGLARALFGNPAFVVLDEPNAALDTEGESALMAALSGLKTRGVTVAIVSHKANVFRSADKLLVLREGRMEMFGPRDQVLAALAPKSQPPPQGQPAPPQAATAPPAQGQPAQGQPVQVQPAQGHAALAQPAPGPAAPAATVAAQ